MATATTMCLSGAVLLKAGANVSSVLTTDASSQIEQFILQAESFINVVTRVNYTDGFADLNADVKKILEDAASSYAAVSCINYDMSGYSSRAEAQTMLDVNWAKFKECIDLLKDKKHTDFMDDA